MHRAFVDQNGLLRWFDADIAIHRLIRELRPVRTHHHPDIADPQSRRRPHVHVAAAIIGAGGDELSVGQIFDDEGLFVRRVTRNARSAAERERDGGTFAGGVRGLCRGGIADHADGGAGGVVADQRAQHAGGVGIAAGAGIVLGVGDDDRLVRVPRQFHGVAHALVGRKDAAVKIVLVTDNEFCHFVRGSVSIGLRPAIGEHARSAVEKVRGRKARRERQRRHRVALQCRKPLIDALAGLVAGALPADRNQERQLPERFRHALPGTQQHGEMMGGGAAGVGHVDMGIGAIGDQRVGMFDHLRRHIGVQVEADHQRQVVADYAADAGENFAFAVVEMFCHHGAMQIEIDGIQWPCRLDAVNHHFGYAFERIFCHMRGGTGGAGDGRHQFPAIGFCLLDKACQSDIDVAHDLEHIGTPCHRRPAAAMHEIVIIRLRRREGVGLVQKAANGDTGHISISGNCWI